MKTVKWRGMDAPARTVHPRLRGNTDREQFTGGSYGLWGLTRGLKASITRSIYINTYKRGRKILTSSMGCGGACYHIWLQRSRMW